MDQFVSTVGAREGLGLGFEAKAHTNDIAHSFFKSAVRFEVGTGIDVGVNFQVDLVLLEQWSKLVGGVDRVLHFQEHALLNGH